VVKVTSRGYRALHKVTPIGFETAHYWQRTGKGNTGSLKGRVLFSSSLLNNRAFSQSVMSETGWNLRRKQRNKADNKVSGR
jgi:hypothetical protein